MPADNKVNPVNELAYGFATYVPEGKLIPDPMRRGMCEKYYGSAVFCFFG